MDIVNQILETLDAELTLWIAGSLAAIFVFIVIYDAIRKRRKLKHHARNLRSVNPLPSRFARVRSAVREMKSEVDRRQRQNARMRRMNRTKR